jgi:hypothetical protein
MKITRNDETKIFALRDLRNSANFLRLCAFAVKKKNKKALGLVPKASPNCSVFIFNFRIRS